MEQNDLNKKKNHDIPLDHLDFKYVDKCDNIKELEKIYKVLLSGVEGRYVDLEHVVENKLRNLAPNSRVLRKDNPILTKHSISKNERSSLEDEIDEFLKSIPNLEKEIAKDNIHNQIINSDESRANESLPPIRNAKDTVFIKSGGKQPSATVNQENKNKPKAASSNKSAKPKNYSEWEKIEKQLGKDLDKNDDEEEVKEEKPKTTEATASSTKNKIIKTIPEKIDTSKDLDDNLKFAKAEQEKLKGNEAFNAKCYEEAVVYYTRSIQLIENAASYNNRALAFLKLEKWDKVIEDCNCVFKYEKENVKALLRRSNAYLKKRKLNEAKLDVDVVLNKEPTNKNAKDLSEQINALIKKETAEKIEIQSKGGKRLTIEETDGESDSGSENEQQKEEEIKVNQPEVKKKIQIKEVEQDDDDEEEEEEKKTYDEKISIDDETQVQEETIIEKQAPIVEKPLPNEIIVLKDKANKFYSSGQYSDAIVYYTKAIDSLSSNEFKEFYSNTQSILLYNRAACKEKIGNYRDVIIDCDLSLELRENNLKVLFKKARAYELLEKYSDSLKFYEKIMKLDSKFQHVQESYNRVRKLLIEKGDIKINNKKESKLIENSSETPPVVVSEVEEVKRETETYDELKLKGNEYFKSNNYEKAIEFYTKCIQLDNFNSLGYLNRSLCYLKVNNNSAQLALDDCNYILNKIEDKKNVKAIYRRSLAYKQLKQFENCLNDLKLLLDIEPNNVIAIKEIETLNSELKEQKSTFKSVNKETKTSTSKPVNEETKTSESKPVNEETKTSTKPAKPPKPVQLPSEITNSYEFLQAWNSINPNDIYTFCLLIEKIDSSKLAKFIGSKLDDTMFSILLKTFHKYLFDDNYENSNVNEDEDGFNLIINRKLDKEQIFSYLKELTKTQRFDVIKLFLNNNSKLLLDECFEFLSKQSSKTITQQDISSTRKSYGI